jgi:hypothetical protein
MDLLYRFGFLQRRMRPKKLKEILKPWQKHSEISLKRCFLFSSSIPDIMFHFHKIRKEQKLLRIIIFLPLLNEERLNGAYRSISFLYSFVFPVRRFKLFMKTDVHLDEINGGQ